MRLILLIMWTAFQSFILRHNNNNNNNNNNNKNNNEARRPDIVFLDKKEGEVIITALVLPPLVMTG